MTIVCLPNNNIGGAEKVIRLIDTHKPETRIFRLDNIKPYLGECNAIGLVDLIKLLAKQRNLVVASHYVFVPLLLLASILGNKTIFRLSTRGLARYKGLKKLEVVVLYLCLNFLTKIICQTEEMKDELAPYILKKGKVEILNNPVFKMRPILNRTINQPYLFTASRLIELKNLTYTIEIFKRLPSDWRLVIAGEGPEENRLQGLAGNLGLTDRVIFVGNIDNVHEYSFYAEACIQTSLLEGFPNTVVEMRQYNENVFSTLSTESIKMIPDLTILPFDDADACASLIANNATRIDNVAWNAYVNRNKENIFVENFLKIREFN